MSIILGSMTQVAVDGYTNGYQSISWNIDNQPNRLWQLGSWLPYRTQVTSVVSLNLTTYAGVLMPINLSPSASCADSTATKRIMLNVSACGPGESVAFDYTMYATSYSYAKEDPVGFGTESWSFQKWVDFSGQSSENFIYVGEPTYVLQGISEGSRSGDVGNGTSDMGVVFNNTTVVSSQQGSVSAGFPGLGNADTTELGIVIRIGGALLQAGGKTGRSNATVPHNPLYLG